MMHGILGLSTPWTRALFPGDARREAEALIPAGFQINVAAVNGRPGPWHVRAFRIGEVGYGTHLIEWTTHKPQWAVATMAQRLADMAVGVESWRLADDMSVSVPLENTGDAA